jgi:DNA-binding transcriptional ArsR family regulator
MGHPVPSLRMSRPRVVPEGAASAALDVLGDPTRRAIVEMLAAGPASVQSLADRLPISRPAVSRHLRLLKGAALVVDDADGTRHIYRLQPDSVDALRDYFERLWTDAANRFRLTVENLDDPRRR